MSSMLIQFASLIAAAPPETGAVQPVSAAAVESVWDFVLKGGIMMIPIGLCSLIGMTVVRLLTWLIGLVTRCMHIKTRGHSWGMRFVLACMPSFMTWVMDEAAFEAVQRRRKRRASQQGEELQALHKPDGNDSDDSGGDPSLSQRVLNRYQAAQDELERTQQRLVDQFDRKRRPSAPSDTTSTQQEPVYASIIKPMHKRQLSFGSVSIAGVATNLLNRGSKGAEEQHPVRPSRRNSTSATKSNPCLSRTESDKSEPVDHKQLNRQLGRLKDETIVNGPSII